MIRYKGVYILYYICMKYYEIDILEIVEKNRFLKCKLLLMEDKKMSMI